MQIKLLCPSKMYTVRLDSLLLVFIFIISASVNSTIQAQSIESHTENRIHSNGNFKALSPQIQNKNSLRGSGMMFIQNKGQIVDMEQKQRPDVLFKGDGGGANIYLRKTGISYVLNNMGEVLYNVDEQLEELEKEGKINITNKQEKKDELLQNQKIKIHRVDVEFINGLPGTITRPETVLADQVEGYNNYYYAHCPQGITNVHSYNEVTIKNMYNNIDIKYYGAKEKGLKYDIVVNPGGNPNDIKLKYSGAESISLNGKQLKIITSAGELGEYMPKVYQNINGKIVDIRAGYILNETTLNFELGTWNHSYPLIIDPWATYFGGSDGDAAWGISTDPSGNALVTGNTVSINLPVTAGAMQITFGGKGTTGYKGDAFIVKFNGNGNRLWSTYYGGSNGDIGRDITCDQGGNVLVAGSTTSTNLPVPVTAYNNANVSTWAGFVLKLNPTGNLIWATYINYGDCRTISTDFLNNVIVAGTANSTSFFTSVGAFQSSAGAASGEMAILKFNPAGSLLWSTCYGGTKTENPWSITTDALGNVLVTGVTTSNDFPVTATAFQTVHGGSGFLFYDAFIVKMDPAGNRIWATYFGGTSVDYGQGIAVDGLGDVIVVGTIYYDQGTITAFPVSPGAFQSASGGGKYEAFVSKFDANGNRKWTTYLGGDKDELGRDVAIDAANNIYVYGEWEDTNSGNYKISPCAHQPYYGGMEDQYIAKYNPAGQQTCVTYMGGPGYEDLDEGDGGIAIFANNLFVAGSNIGGAYPVSAGAFQTLYGGTSTDNFVNSKGDAIITSICTNICEPKNLDVNFNANNTTLCTNAPVTYTPYIFNTCDTSGITYEWTFNGGNPASSTALNPIVTYPSPGNYDVKLVVTTGCKKDSMTHVSFLKINSCTGILTATINGTSIKCNGANTGTATVTAISGTANYSYNWSNGASSITNSPNNSLANLPAGNYTVTITDGASNTATAVVTIIEPSIKLITSIDVGNISCTISGTATVNVSNSIFLNTYSWSTGEKTQTTQIPVAGVYTVTVTDANGCTLSQTCTVGGSSPVNGTFIPPATICRGSTFTFTNIGTGPVISWSFIPPNYPTDPASYFSTTTATYTFTALGVYKIQLYNALTGYTCYSKTIRDVLVIDCSNPTVTATPAAICSGTCANITSTPSAGTSPYTYLWSNGATTQNINTCPLTNTTYTLTITDAGGNTATTNALVSINPGITITTTSTNITCNGATNGSITTNTGNGTAPYTYIWSGIVGQTSPTATGLAVGNYTVTVSDSKGCTSTSATSVTSPLPLSGQFTKGTGNCSSCGCKEWIMVSAFGGTSPYSYTWPNGYNNRYKNQLCPGSYTINITDKNGCSINTNLTTP